MSEGLLPCPHCGGEAEFETYGGTACAVTCRKCRCGTPTVRLNDGERAVEAWNRRAERTCRAEVSHGSHGPEPRFPGDVWTMHHVCSACGGPVDRGDGYCRNCGARLEEGDE